MTDPEPTPGSFLDSLTPEQRALFQQVWADGGDGSNAAILQNTQSAYIPPMQGRRPPYEFETPPVDEEVTDG